MLRARDTRSLLIGAMIAAGLLLAVWFVVFRVVGVRTFLWGAVGGSLLFGLVWWAGGVILKELVRLLESTSEPKD